MRYASKPQEVEAVQWTGDKESFERLLDALMPVKCEDELTLYAGKNGAQGWVPVPVGHWIVRKPDDYWDHWPVDPDYFAEKYQTLEASDDLANEHERLRASYRYISNALGGYINAVNAALIALRDGNTETAIQLLDEMERSHE